MAGGSRRKNRRSAATPSARHELLQLEVLKQFRIVYGAVHRHFREIERRCGLSGAQAWMLREIGNAPLLGVSDLAARMSVHQSTASQMVEKLVRSRCVERAVHDSDRRRVLLRLTNRGVALARRVPQPAEGVLPRALGKLPGKSLRSLQADLEKLIVQLKDSRAQDAGAPLERL